MKTPALRSTLRGTDWERMRESREEIPEAKCVVIRRSYRTKRYRTEF